MKHSKQSILAVALAMLALFLFLAILRPIQAASPTRPPMASDNPFTGDVSGGGVLSPRTASITVGDQICSLTKYSGNPVLSVGPDGDWDDEAVREPTVLKEGDTYKMWYFGFDGSISQIGLATSPDGLTWTKSDRNPVLSPDQSWEGTRVFAPSVISDTDSGLYLMWYAGADSNWIDSIGFAWSDDGVDWQKHPDNPVLEVGSSGSWDDEDILSPAVLKVGSTYHMWYTGRDGVTARIGHATSGNGTSWTKDGANPVLDIGPPGAWDWTQVYGPGVVQVGGGYQLWYSGETLPLAWESGYATSIDGSNWTRGRMLIPEGAPGSFDVNSADYASAVVDGDQVKVWYSGLDDSWTYNIGYATAGACGPLSAQPVYLPLVLKSFDPRYPCSAYYTDDFSDPDSGWYVDDSSDRRYAYVSGQYQIWAKKPDNGWWATSGAKATDFTAAVSARRASGSGGYSITFGINEDGSELYRFDIGMYSYRIRKYNNGWTPLRDWTSSSHIKTGTSWNRLKVIREGSSIAVYVNDHYLTTVTNGSFTGLRRIGLAAFSYDNPLDARFDDFALYPASCGPSAAGVGFETGEAEIHEAPVPPGLDQGR
jgi:hypothetical protein